MVGEYTVRHNLIVNRLSEAIKLNCRIIGEVQENKQVRITATEGKNDKLFHSQIRPDIWHWTDEATDDSVPEHQRVLNLVEVKSFQGSVYEPMIDKEGGNTIDECRRNAQIKYKKAVDGIYLAVKNNIGTARIIIRYHIIAVSSFCAFDQNSKEELERILNTTERKQSTFGGSV
jgi:hypothetical protein